MAEFERNIENNCIEAIRSAPWFQFVRDDRDLFFAIRNESANVYYKGNSIARILCVNNGIQIETHYKYLLRPDMPHPYLRIPIVINEENKGFFDDYFVLDIQSQRQIDMIKRASNPYAGLEKTGVHEILKSNRHSVIDVEIALSQGDADNMEDQEEFVEYPDGEEENGNVVIRGVRRIDLAAFIEEEQGVVLRFYEAKHFNNKDIRSGANTAPHVIQQLSDYQNLIQQQAVQIQSAYQNQCKIIYAIFQNHTPGIIAEIAQGIKTFSVDPNPKLVVFGFDSDQIAYGANGRTHLDRLENVFQVQLIKKGNPKGLVLR